MKKHFISLFIAVVICLAMALSGCAAVKIFEKDLQLVLKVDSEVHAIYDVSIYKNAVVTAPKSKEEGKGFYGWSPQENWAELSEDEVIIVPNGTFITYNDVKDFVPEGSASLTLYATFFEIPVKDLVIGWYRAEGVSTDTGLTQDIMDAFKGNMFTYLETKEYVPADMEIVIRAYDGNVGNSCGNILSDGDVDIMIGWAGNITSTGGITAKQNESGVSVGTVSRYAARLNDKYLTRLIYVWILNTYGGRELPEPEENIEQPPAKDSYSMVIGWYSKTDTTGLSADMMAAFKTAVDAYLTSQGYEHGALIYDLGSGNVASVAAAVTEKGDVDLIFGMGTNIAANIELKKDDANYTLLSFTDNNKHVVKNVCCIEKVNMDTKIRNIALTAGSTSEAAKAVWNWLVGTSGNNGWLSIEAAKTVGIWVQGEEPECTHNYPADDYQKDDTRHWQICDLCHEPSEKAVHEYGDDGKCVCGAIESEDPGPSNPEAHNLVIGWWKNTTSGLSQTIMDNLKTGLNTYLTSLEYDLTEITITVREYDGDLATTAPMIIADNDVDVVLGYGVNLKSSGGVDFVDRESGVAMGNKTGRYIYQLADNEFTKLVYDWMKTDEAKALLV